MQNFQKLEVWRRAHWLTLRIYSATRRFPKDEMYGLRAQLRRTSASISANIAEGCGRGTQRELIRFLHMAAGSASELECHVILSRDLRFLDRRVASEIAAEVTTTKRMLTRPIARIKDHESDSSN